MTQVDIKPSKISGCIRVSIISNISDIELKNRMCSLLRIQISRCSQSRHSKKYQVVLTFSDKTSQTNKTFMVQSFQNYPLISN